MKKTILLSFPFLCLMFGCKLPTVHYFTTQPNNKAYQMVIDKSMTIVVDQDIRDTLVIKSAGVKKMTVLSFRQSLEEALKNTFRSSYNEINVLNSHSQKGVSLVLIKVNPDWNKKSSKTVVTGSYGNTNSRTLYELESKINFQAILYSDGEKKGVIEGIVYSDKSTFKAKDTPDVFKDGITKMCEDIYKQTVTFK